MPTQTPFDATAQGYDLEFTNTTVGRVQREMTHRWLQAMLGDLPGKSVLELNCGTGEDAKWMAQQGMQVLATDLSAEMVARTAEKTKGLEVNAQVCSITELATLANAGPFDLVWSNFGGFNCLDSAQLQSSAAGIAQVLKPGGLFMAVVMGRFCAWETAYFLAKLQPSQAFRRFSKGPVRARLDDKTFQDTWYYGPKQFANAFSTHFHPVGKAGIGIFMPPSYLDPFLEKRPKFRAWLERKERKWSSVSFCAGFSDHFLVAFRKK